MFKYIKGIGLKKKYRYKKANIFADFTDM